MRNDNISDIIEKYLKGVLTNEPRIRISRSQIANQFDVVPSQINYVIKTRFTMSDGYLVKSKRGDGGYIRIKRVKLNHTKILETLLHAVSQGLSFREGKALVNTLHQAHLLNQKEMNLVLTIISHQTLKVVKDSSLENLLRARIMTSILNRLRLKD